MFWCQDSDSVPAEQPLKLTQPVSLLIWKPDVRWLKSFILLTDTAKNSQGLEKSDCDLKR